MDLRTLEIFIYFSAWIDSMSISCLLVEKLWHDPNLNGGYLRFVKYSKTAGAQFGSREQSKVYGLTIISDPNMVLVERFEQLYDSAPWLSVTCCHVARFISFHFCCHVDRHVAEGNLTNVYIVQSRLWASLSRDIATICKISCDFQPTWGHITCDVADKKAI